METLINIKDKTTMKNKLMEIGMSVVVSIILITIINPEDRGIGMIPILAVALLMFLDGVFGFLVAKKGVTINLLSKELSYPKWYKIRIINILEISEMEKTFKISTDKNFKEHYTYYIELTGNFGKTKISFKSEESRDEVYKIIKEIK